MKDKNGKELIKQTCNKCGLKESGYFYIYSNAKKIWTTCMRICQNCGHKVIFNEMEAFK